MIAAKCNVNVKTPKVRTHDACSGFYVGKTGLTLQIGVQGVNLISAAEKRGFNSIATTLRRAGARK